MCIKHLDKPSKKFLESSFGEDLILFHRTVSKKDPDILYVNNDEMMYVICTDGQLIPIYNPGFYKVLSKPVEALWLKKVPSQFKIGVPKNSTSHNIGFHAIIDLHLIDAKTLIKNRELEHLRKDTIRDLLLSFSRQVFETLGPPDGDLDNYKKEFNRRLNELLMMSKYSGFAAATVYIGFSYMCKNILKEVK